MSDGVTVTVDESGVEVRIRISSMERWRNKTEVSRAALVDDRVEVARARLTEALGPAPYIKRPTTG